GRTDDRRGADRPPREDRAPRPDNGPRSDGPRSDGPRSDGPRDRDNNRQQQFDGPPGDPGNRRSRRRRGRDRGERDLQPARVQGQGGQEPSFSGEPVPADGLLDLRDEGYGFLRTHGYLAGANDVYVSLSQVRRFGLRKGDVIKG